MAITIESSPPKENTAYNDIEYIVSSTNVAQTNFKYIADVYIGADMIRVASPKHPVYNNGFFNIGRIVEDYVTSNIAKGEAGFQQNTDSYISYYVKFGEEYGTTPTVYTNLTTSATAFSWNGILDFLEYGNYDVNNFIFGQSTPKFLTNAPQSGVIRDNEDAWLYMVADSDTDVYLGYARTYDSNGTLIQEVGFSNPFYNSGSNNSKFLRMPAGTNNLNDVPSSGVVWGSLPIITASVDNYDVGVYPLVGGAMDYQNYKIDNTCTKNSIYRFHFLNKLGGYDSFTFYRGQTKTSTINRESYKKIASVATSATTKGYSNSSRGKKDYNTKISDNIQVESDWISEGTKAWLEELISSPDVYLDDATYGLVAVNINNSSYEFNQESQQKLFSLIIDFTYSYDRARQRG